MTNKPLLFAAAILSTVAFAAPKAYNVVISKPLQVGTAQLTPGSYKMVLEGDKAVFTIAHHTAVTVPVKVETAARKYSETVLDAVDKGGTLHLNFIALGGSTNKVEFDK
jgi:hypothetical protein